MSLELPDIGQATCPLHTVYWHKVEKDFVIWQLSRCLCVALGSLTSKISGAGVTHSFRKSNTSRVSANPGVSISGFGSGVIEVRLGWIHTPTTCDCISVHLLFTRQLRPRRQSEGSTPILISTYNERSGTLIFRASSASRCLWTVGNLGIISYGNVNRVRPHKMPNEPCVVVPMRAESRCRSTARARSQGDGTLSRTSTV